MTIAISTVTSDGFLAGTCVAIHSFLRANPSFDGNIIIIFDRLSAEGRNVLLANFPNVILREVSAQFRTALDRLVDVVPSLARRRDRFLSLDVFALDEFDQVLFFDSDTVFTRDVSELFVRTEPLLAAPDSAQLLGLYRDRDSFLTAEISENALPDTFNAGLMRIGAPCLGVSNHKKLLEALSPDNWAGHESPFTDQRILNQYFAGSVTMIDRGFNLLMGTAPAPETGDIANAAMLHFNGPNKPWRAPWSAAAGAPRPARIQALKLWYDAQQDFLLQWHLRNVGRLPGAAHDG